MSKQEGINTINKAMAALPTRLSDTILKHIHSLTEYEPVIGIMGKTGAGKSSLCNALFAGEVSPVSDVAACTREPLRFRLQVGERYMTIVDLPGVREQARSDFGETVGAVLDSISAFPLIPAPVRAVIQAVRTTVVSVARAVWDFFF
ncbi:GTPase [Escherichia coli]|nr:50S ribosome-binding GTPase [Escherichia coli]